MKLSIGIPCVNQTVPIQFFTSFLAMDKPDFTLLMPDIPSGMIAQRIATVRNSLVRQALYNDSTLLIMCDTDQIYPVDCITKLLSHDLDVVAVRVHRRYPPFEPIMNRGELTKYHHISDDECFSGDLIEVDSTGTGCICYNMQVFKSLSDPWFYRKDSPDKPVGEDVRLCSNLKDAGYKIYIDTSIEVGHLTTMVINRSFYELFKAVKGYEWNKPKEN